MPFRSEKQRRFMYANHPEIAKRWSAEYGSQPLGGLVKHAGKGKRRRRGKPR
jgi:hypothetical protein